MSTSVSIIYLSPCLFRHLRSLTSLSVDLGSIYPSLNYLAVCLFIYMSNNLPISIYFSLSLSLSPFSPSYPQFSVFIYIYFYRYLFLSLYTSACECSSLLSVYVCLSLYISTRTFLICLSIYFALLTRHCIDTTTPLSL